MVEWPSVRLPNGAVVDIEDKSGAWVGRGFFNGHSRIALRVLTADKNEPIDAAFFASRIARAAAFAVKPCAQAEAEVGIRRHGRRRRLQPGQVEATIAFETAGRGAGDGDQLRAFPRLTQGGETGAAQQQLKALHRLENHMPASRK